MNSAASIRVCMLAAFLLALTVGASFAGDWAGKYRTEDTKGNVFAITLAGSGTATGEKEGHVLNGTWTEEDGAAVIEWDTGWTTKLSKDGDHYKKTAYRAGTAMQEGPTHATHAEKIE
jgi:hypothetical protein